MAGQENRSDEPSGENEGDLGDRTGRNFVLQRSLEKDNGRRVGENLCQGPGTQKLDAWGQG